MKRDKDKFHKELEFNKNSDKLRALQESLRKKYSYILEAPAENFAYVYAKSQAEKILEMEKELRFSPFKSFYSKYLGMITEPKFMQDNYLHFNEFDSLELDEKRLNTLRRIKIDYSNLKDGTSDDPK